MDFDTIEMFNRKLMYELAISKKLDIARGGGKLIFPDGEVTQCSYVCTCDEDEKIIPVIGLSFIYRGEYCYITHCFDGKKLKSFYKDILCDWRINRNYHLKWDELKLIQKGNYNQFKKNLLEKMNLVISC